MLWLAVLCLMSTCSVPAFGAEAWNAFNDYSPSVAANHDWSYVYQPGFSWSGNWNLYPMVKSVMYPEWWESPVTPYLWSPQVGLTPEWARIKLTGCRKGDNATREPGLGVLRWTAPSGGYYRIRGNGYIYPQVTARLLALSNRLNSPFLDTTVNTVFDERSFDQVALLNKGDNVAFTAEPIVGHGQYEFVGSYWTAQVDQVPTVPLPWTPLVVGDHYVSCWNRTYDFMESLLPVAIMSGGVNLLSDSIAVDAKVSGVSQQWDTATFLITRSDPDVVELTTTSNSPLLRATCKFRIEFDGFLLCELTLAPVSGAVNLSSLDLVVPFNQAYAKLFHHHPVKPLTQQNWITDTMNCGAIPGNGMALPFVNHIWIGDEKRGLQWFAESDQGLSPNGPFVNLGSNKVMRLRLLGAKTITSAAPFRYVFGLMASPVKPMVPADSIRWAFPGGGIGIWNHDYYGNPTSPENSWLAQMHNMGVNCLNLWDAQTMGDPIITDPDLPNLLNAAAGYGISVLGSTGIWIDQNTAGFNTTTWPLKPDLTWVGDGIVARAMCQKGPWQQWFLDRAERSFTQLQMGGLYLDGPVVAQSCTNLAHGCGYVSGSTTKYTSPILATRELMKQLYLLSRANGQQRLLLAHTSSSIFLPCMSFADAYLEGEHVNSYPEAGQPLNIDGSGVDHTNPTYTLEGFRAEMIGAQYGIPSFYLKYARPGYENEDAERCSAYALVHGMMPLSLAHAPAAWKAYNDFGAFNAQWIPYWEAQRPITSGSALRISSYVKYGQGAMAVVANLTGAAIASTLHIDRTMLGLDSSATVWDIKSQRSLSINADTASVTVGPGKYLLIQAGYRDTSDINLVMIPEAGATATYTCSTAADSSRTAGFAADGDLYTGWQSALESWPTSPTPRPALAWWKVTWSEPQTFNVIQVAIPADPLSSPGEFVVETWNTARSAWDTIARVKRTDNALLYVVYLPNPVTTTDLRYRVLNTKGLTYGPNTRGGAQEIRVYNRNASAWATINGIVRDSLGNPVRGAHVFLHSTDSSGDSLSFKNTHIVGSVTASDGSYSLKFDPSAYPSIDKVCVQANGLSVTLANPNVNYTASNVAPVAGQTVACDVTLPGPAEAYLQLGGLPAGPWLSQALNMPGTNWETENAVVLGKPCAQLLAVDVLFRVNKAFADGRFDRLYVDVEYFDDGINGINLLAPPVPETYSGGYYIPGPSKIRKENSQTWRTQTLVYENSLLTDWWVYGNEVAMFGLEPFEDGTASNYDYLDSIASVRLRFAPMQLSAPPSFSCSAGSHGDHISRRFNDDGLHVRLIPALLGEDLGIVVENVADTGRQGYKTANRRYVVLDVDNNYWFGPKDQVVLRIDYFDDVASAAGIRVEVRSAGGGVSSRTIRKNGTNTWRTAVVAFQNVELSDGYYGCGDILLDDNGDDDIIGGVSVLADTAPLSYSSIAQAKTASDYSAISLPAMSVTAVFSDCFYIEDDARSSGIRVIGDAEVRLGDRVILTGWLLKNGAEREIHASSIEIVSP
jgi:hypothetical protein